MQKKLRYSIEKCIVSRWLKKPSIRHIAGIVPVSGQSIGFNMPWHDSLMPIGEDYLAVENAVFQCAMARCNTIWIVCHMGMQPLLRKRIGDRIRWSDLSNMNIEDENPGGANIFYVPIHPKDMERRDSLGFSVLYGAKMAHHICKMISKWVVPGKFFCSFPYGITDGQFIKQNRKILRSEKNVYFSYNGKTIKDGLPLPFTFDEAQYKICRTTVKTYTMEKYGTYTTDSNLKMKAKMSLEEVFRDYNIADSVELECPLFYDIMGWEKYRNFMASDLRLKRDTDYFVEKEGRKKLEEILDNVHFSRGRGTLSENKKDET